MIALVEAVAFYCRFVSMFDELRRIIRRRRCRCGLPRLAVRHCNPDGVVRQTLVHFRQALLRLQGLAECLARFVGEVSIDRGG